MCSSDLGEFSHYQVRSIEHVFVPLDVNTSVVIPPLVNAQPIVDETPKWETKTILKWLGVAVAAEAVYLIAFDKDDKKSDANRDLIAPAEPTANLDENGEKLSGKTEANARITVKDQEGKVLGETVANAEGNYSMSLSRSIINNEKITVLAKDRAGNESKPTIVAGTKDTLAPDLANAQFSVDGKMISGSAEAGAKVYIYDADGKTLLAGPVKVAQDGHFSISLSNALATGQQAQVLVEDTAGNRSEFKKVIVGQDTFAPEPAKAEVNAAGDKITGQAEALAKIILRDAKDGLLAQTTADAQGKFSLELKTPLNQDQPALLSVQDAAGNSSQTIALIPSFDNIAPQAAQANLNAEGTVIRGTAEAKAKIEVYGAQGSSLGTTEADDQGKFSLTLNTALLNQATASIYVLDAAGNRSTVTTLTGTTDTVAPDVVLLSKVTDDVGVKKGTIAANSETDDARPKFEGTGEANATITIYDLGIAIGTVKVAENQSWSYTPAQDLSLGEHQFSFTQMDAANNTSSMSSSFNFKVIAVSNSGDTDGEFITGNRMIEELLQSKENPSSAQFTVDELLHDVSSREIAVPLTMQSQYNYLEELMQASNLYPL